MVQRALAVVATGALAFSGVAVSAAAPTPTAAPSIAVSAAKKSPVVAIKKIGTKTVKGSAKATIKPSYSKAKNVKIKSALLKVVKGKKTIASKKKSVKLAAGTYKVTTTVKYQLKGQDLDRAEDADLAGEEGGRQAFREDERQGEELPGRLPGEGKPHR